MPSSPIDAKQKLPLLHPEYRYSPAKNPYSEKLKDHSDIVFSDNDSEKYAGHWRTRFPVSSKLPAKTSSTTELHVEIGCNTGHVVREWARLNPQNLYIGIDWKFKIVHQGAEKAKKKSLENILFMRANVERIAYMFGPGEIDAAYLYFPDPWPKKSQLKNRFIKADSLRLIAKVVKPGGLFHIKTDHDSYFEWMKDAINEVKDLWEIEKITHDLHAGNPEATRLKIPEITLFEGLFIKDGIKIKSVHLRRKA